MANPRLCSIPECGKPHKAKGYCDKHYQRLQSHGDATQTHRYDGELCSIAACENPAKAHRLCQMHYARLRKHGDPLKGAAVRYHGCEIQGCDRPHNARGLCKIHYDRLLYSGDPKADQEVRTSPGERLDWLMDHKDYDGDGCLIFPYSRDHGGYGRAKHEGKQITASRMMAIIVLGEPPTEDHQSAHDCGNGHLGCVHPKHLRWDSCEGNMADKLIHGTHMQGTDCPAHKLDEADIREIRRLAGTTSQQDLADRFGIAQTTVSRIVRRKTWSWVDG